MFSSKNAMHVSSYIHRRVEELREQFGQQIAACAVEGVSEVDMAIHSTSSGELENQIQELLKIKAMLYEGS